MKRTVLIKWVTVYSFFMIVCYSCKSSQAKPTQSDNSGEVYKCMPCGADCDRKSFDKVGVCPDCNMKLVQQTSITFKSISADQICEFIKNRPTAVLLDVRSKKEFEGKGSPDFGTLKNAINIPIQELENRLPEIANLKAKEILVFCSHSHRSPRASYLLTQNGFSNITNMNGGMSQVSDSACKN